MAVTWTLVGSPGSVAASSSGGALSTLAFGSGESRTAGNLLVCWLSTTGGGPASAPSGWSQATEGTQSLTTGYTQIFYRQATGGDAAPTFSAISGAVQTGQLAEFNPSVAGAVVVDQTAAQLNSTTATPLVLTASAANQSTGELVVAAFQDVVSRAATDSVTNTFNNGGTVATATAYTASNTIHYQFYYDLAPTSNSAADSWSHTYTTTRITGATGCMCSFMVIPAPYVQSAGGYGSTGTTAGFTLPNAPTPGNRILAFISYTSSTSAPGAITSVADNTLISLTKLWGQTRVGNSGTEQIDTSVWAYDSPGGFSSGPRITATGTTGSTGLGMACVVQEIAGAAGYVIDGTPGVVTGFGGSVTTSPAYSSLAAGEDLISVYFDDGGPATVQATQVAFTKDPHSVNGNSFADCYVTWATSTGGAETSGFAMSGTVPDWTAVTFALMAPATVTRIGSVVSTASVGSTSTITVGASGVPAGDAIVIPAFFSNRSGTPAAPTDSAGNTYLLKEGPQLDGATDNGYVWVCANCKALASGNTITVTTPGSGSGTPEGMVAAYDVHINGASGTAFDVGASGGAMGNGSATTGDFTTTQATEVLLGIVGFQSSSTTQPPLINGYDALDYASPASGDGAIWGYRMTGGTTAAADAFGATLTSSSSASWAALAVTIYGVSGPASYSLSITETVGAGAATVTVHLSYTRATSETAGPAADTVTTSRVKTTGLAETVGAATDTTTRAYQASRTASETVGPGADTASRAATHPRSQAETAGPTTDTVARTWSTNRPLAETVGPTGDVATYLRSKVASVAEAMGPVADAVARVLSAYRAAAETIGPGVDAASGIKQKLAGITDTTGPAADGISKLASWVRVASESYTTIDSATRLYSGGRPLSETVGHATDSASGLKQKLAGISEAVGPVGDSATRAVSLHRTLSESVGPALDAASKAWSTSRSLTETLTGSQSVTYAMGRVRAVVESQSASDALQRVLGASRAASESVGPAVDSESTSGAGQVSLAEAVGAALDAVQRLYSGHRASQESYTASDATTASSAHPRTATETVGPAQASLSGSGAHPRAATESVGPVATSTTGAALHPRSPSETVSAADSVSRIYGSLRVVAEAVGPAHDDESANGSGAASVLEATGPSTDSTQRLWAGSRYQVEGYGASDTVVRQTDAHRLLTEAVGPAFDKAVWAPGMPGPAFRALFRDGEAQARLRDGEGARAAMRDGVVTATVRDGLATAYVRDGEGLICTLR